jgi:serine/threonine kinase PknH
VDGTPFGRYLLVELLGRGGMGEVWRAHDTATDRTVAVKLLPPHLAEDDAFVQRFRREAHAAAQLNSPHVIPIHNYGEIDGRLYVDMRLIEGRDLQSVLADGAMAPGRAVRIIEQVAKALQAAHRVGLVHRDVKPSNILLDEDDFAYLIDFGIARGIDQSRLTGTGSIIGSWHYMSPERLRAGQVDARADIYALACVLYECLTGSTPFPGDNFEQQITAHLTAPPPRPSSTDPNVPVTFDPVIATGMAKNPDQRYATTVELANAAHNAITTPLAAPTLLAGPTRPAPEAARRDYQMPPPPAPAQQPVWQQPAGPPPWQPVPRSDRNQWLVLGVAAVVVVAALAGAGIYIGTKKSNKPAATSTTTTPTSTTATTTAPTRPPPVAGGALQGLLLSPDQINTAMGATSMTVTGPNSPTGTYDASAVVADKACLPLVSPAQSEVYSGSGFTALFGQELTDPGEGTYIYTHRVTQVVVLFPSAHDADAFFTASAQQWPACANRQYNYATAGKPDQVWTVGPVSNTNGTLSASETIGGGDASWTWNWSTCQRTLTVANNVAIDVSACRKNQSDSQSDSAVNIAHQIAAKVSTT